MMYSNLLFVTLSLLVGTTTSASDEFESWWKTRKDEQILCSSENKDYEPKLSFRASKLPELDMIIDYPDDFSAARTLLISRSERFTLALALPKVPDISGLLSISEQTERYVQCVKSPSRLVLTDSGKFLDIPFFPTCEGDTSELNYTQLALYEDGRSVYLEFVPNGPAGIPYYLYRITDDEIVLIDQFLSAGC